MRRAGIIREEMASPLRRRSCHHGCLHPVHLQPARQQNFVLQRWPPVIGLSYVLRTEPVRNIDLQFPANVRHGGSFLVVPRNIVAPSAAAIVPPGIRNSNNEDAVSISIADGEAPSFVDSEEEYEEDEVFA